MPPPLFLSPPLFRFSDAACFHAGGNVVAATIFTLAAVFNTIIDYLFFAIFADAVTHSAMPPRIRPAAADA